MKKIKEPIKLMRNMLKGFNITAKDIKDMRSKDENHDNREKSI